MSRRLPPLNAVRAFEAAARCGNFTRAAQELCVTQGAVSRHVGALEDWLKVRLFERTARGIALTPQGQVYYAAVRGGLEQIEHGTLQVQRSPDERRLRIKLPPTFAIRWLMPRLARFHAKHPDIDVQITTSHQRADFDRDDVDVSIHSESVPPQGAACRRLFGETLLPVCAPGLLETGPRLRVPDDLAQHVLLCSMNRPKDWPAWLKAAGARGVDGNSGLKFENAALAYQAAADQLGVIVALLPFVRDDLAAGRLIEPFGVRVRTPGAYWIATRAAGTEQPQRVQAFEEWILAEAAQDGGD
ncbi:transcriptional regulator GcvA [Ramlibacter ginsenosidimutans]|uniref:Transcriptional regulator GcvA n=1 Tax=Ramlibacter ginsenosidimutans TaxID=502333 RepID=A0A934WL76_9BURK|nr:transcriptional regulator GcvA [Ramlibacter ginsenosidimutans]MBK6004817.1 transcriptional regulator GcvA [Ramlibacter ginsenosidimutans]